MILDQAGSQGELAKLVRSIVSRHRIFAVQQISGIYSRNCERKHPGPTFSRAWAPDGQKAQSDDVRVNAIRSCQKADAFIVMLQKHNTSSGRRLLRTRASPYML